MVARGNPWPLPLNDSSDSGRHISTLYVYDQKVNVSSKLCVDIELLSLKGVPQEVDSYHTLCPIEPLDTPTDQVCYLLC